MSQPTSTSYLNNAACVKEQTSQSAVGEVKEPSGHQVTYKYPQNIKNAVRKYDG